MKIKVVVSFLFLLCVFTSPANAEQSTTNDVSQQSSKLSTINADNVDQLIIVMTNDFNKQLKQIETQYHFSRTHRDARSFLVWHLRAFVPEQSQLESYYQTVFTTNKDFLSTTDVTPLLPAFKSLTPITVNLIEAMRDSNAVKLEEAKKKINEAKAAFNKVIDAHKLTDKVSTEK